MNELWIKDGVSDSAWFLKDKRNIQKTSWLDIMGLFETGWMMYNFDKEVDEKIKYGYPT